MTDIKIKIERYADKENLKKLMRYLKNTFVNKSEIKELIDQSGDGKPISLKLDLVRFVSTLPELDAAEEGVLYFVPTDIAGEYDLYAKETVDGVAKFVKNSSLHISGDLDGFLLKADAEKEYISTASVADDTITLSRPDGSTVVITVNNVAHATKADQDGNGDVIADTYATKTELASKANTSDLSNYYTKSEIDNITIYDLIPDGEASHRNFYRGKDLTSTFESGELSKSITDGTFRDIFPGDYITKSITVPQILKADGTTEYIAQKTYTVNFIIADLDIWLHRGYPTCETHHVAIVPESVIFNSYMNATNTTEGGYKGSFMNKTVMPAFGEALRNAFGNDHILQFEFFDTNAVNNDLKPSGIVNLTGATYWGTNGHEWGSHYCHLMTETMVYGAPITASCAADEIMGGVQMAAFRLNSNLFYNGQVYWLSDVVSSAHFAHFGFVGGGGVGADSASLMFGVRPFALLR